MPNALIRCLCVCALACACACVCARLGLVDCVHTYERDNCYAFGKWTGEYNFACLLMFVASRIDIKSINKKLLKKEERKFLKKWDPEMYQLLRLQLCCMKSLKRSGLQKKKRRVGFYGRLGRMYS